MSMDAFGALQLMSNWNVSQSQGTRKAHMLLLLWKRLGGWTRPKKNVGGHVLLGIRIKFGNFNLAICCFTLPIHQIRFLTKFFRYTVGSPWMTGKVVQNTEQPNVQFSRKNLYNQPGGDEWSFCTPLARLRAACIHTYLLVSSIFVTLIN